MVDLVPYRDVERHDRAHRELQVTVILAPEDRVVVLADSEISRIERHVVTAISLAARKLEERVVCVVVLLPIISIGHVPNFHEDESAA